MVLNQLKLLHFGAISHWRATMVVLHDGVARVDEGVLEHLRLLLLLR